MVFVNEAMLKLTEYSKEEVIGKPILSFFEGRQKETFLKNIQKRIKGHRFTYEYKELYVKTKKGSIKPVLIFESTIDYKNEPVGFGMFVDRTEDKACEILYESMSDINQLIVLADNEHALLQDVCNTLVNKTGFSLVAIGSINQDTKLYEMKIASAKNNNFPEIFKKLNISVDPSLDEGKGSISIAYRTKKVAFIANVSNDDRMAAWRSYQKEFGVYSVCSIPLIKNDKVKYILTVYSSISDFFTQKHLSMLEELQLDLSFAIENIQSLTNKTLFNEAINKAHEWAVISDKTGRVLYANKAVSDISGYSKNEIIGQNPRVFKSGYHNKEFYENLWRTINSGKEFSCRFVNRAKDGSLFYLNTIIVPIIQNGEVYRFVDISRDVTKEVEFSKRLEFQSSLYNTLYHLTNLSMNVLDKNEYMEKLPDIFAKYTDIDMALTVGLKGKELELKAQCIKDDKHSSLPLMIKNAVEKLSSSGDTVESLPVFKALKTGNIYVQNDIIKESCAPFREIAKHYSMASCCALPLRQKSKAVAACVLISKQKNLFDSKLYKLLETVSKQIEFILNKIKEDKFHNIVLAALDTGFEFVVITDRFFNIVYVNKTVRKLSGYKEEELLGKCHSIFSSKKHSKEFAKKFYKTLNEGRIFSGVMTYKIKNGKLLDFISTVVPYKVNNSTEYYIGVGKRLTKKELLIKEVDTLLHKDNLTGLLNTNTFVESIEKFLLRAKQKNIIGAVAIINPISFKRINEAFGFDMGNELLRHIAKRLKNSVFEYDVIAKLESDRFGLILKDLKQEEDSLIALSRILSELVKPYHIKNKTVVISFNIGLSLYPKDAATPRGLINKAQIALADAKSKGEDGIGFFRKDFEDKAAKLVQLKTELEFALKRREFLAYYQPYVNVKSEIAGAESLIRWQKDERIIPPMEFIPYLERSNLIVDTEDYFLDTVLRYIAYMEKSNMKPVPVSVNLSAKSLNKKGIFNSITSKLKQYGVDASNLKIEIIERSFLKNFDYLKDLIRKFKKNGVQFSVDDFGTGYSSLSYLAQLPVDYIKIDISFVRTLHLKHTKSIVNSIIFMAKELNMKTIAEGVETENQFETLKNMGCDYFQGYLFYKPMTQDEFSVVLKNIS